MIFNKLSNYCIAFKIGINILDIGSLDAGVGARPT